MFSKLISRILYIKDRIRNFKNLIRYKIGDPQSRRDRAYHKVRRWRARGHITITLWQGSCSFQLRDFKLGSNHMMSWHLYPDQVDQAGYLDHHTEVGRQIFGRLLRLPGVQAIQPQRHYFSLDNEEGSDWRNLLPEVVAIIRECGCDLPVRLDPRYIALEECTQLVTELFPEVRVPPVSRWLKWRLMAAFTRHRGRWIDVIYVPSLLDWLTYIFCYDDLDRALHELVNEGRLDRYRFRSKMRSGTAYRRPKQQFHEFALL